LLLITAAGPEQPASSITLLAGPAGDTQASAVFLPTSTLVHVPGLGLDQLAAAHRYGGPELVRAAVENALSVPIDEVASVTETAFADFLDRAGEVDVALPARVVERSEDGSATLLFERGAQSLGGSELAALWLHGSADEEEFGAFQRRQLVLGEVLAASEDTRVRDRLVADGAPQLRVDAEPTWIRELFGDLTAAHSEERLRFGVLPVERFGATGADGRRAYRLHEEDTKALVRTFLGGPQDVATDDVVRAQVLNGVGTPGVGRLVDRLVAGEVRLVLTGNANHFEHTETKLVIYEETPEALQVADRVRDRLGVGTIQVSRQPQSIVDLTIVVGADLVAATEPPEHLTDGSESTD
jgi:polyisoprenyl-teichoic acid--peptidoglycan teichoic acid transferase